MLLGDGLILLLLELLVKYPVVALHLVVVALLLIAEGDGRLSGIELGSGVVVEPSPEGVGGVGVSVCELVVAVEIELVPLGADEQAMSGLG